MKNVIFLIAFGPEVRSFIHSGLIEAANRKFHAIAFTFSAESKKVSGDQEDESVFQMPTIEEKTILKKMRWYANQSTIYYWSRKNGFKKWRQHLSPSRRINDNNKETLKSLFFSPLMIQALLNKAEKYFGRISGSEKEWQRHFRQTNPALVVVASSDARILPAIQTARNMGIKTCLIFNSWKDLYTRPHVPDLFDFCVVWNDEMKHDLLMYNPHIKEDHVKTSFPLHFTYLLKKPLWKESMFREKIGADSQRPLIVYTAASPQAVYQEEAVVRDITEAIKDFAKEKKPQIIVRLNPMEIHAPRFSAIRKSYPDDIILNYPRWEWDPEHDWCCAHKEDLDLMNALIHYADLHISLPSTMTFEFAFADKPMINIVYDPIPPQNSESSLKRFWHGDFYEDIRQSGAVQPADSHDSLNALITQYLSNPSLHSESRKHLVQTMLGLPSGEPVSEMVSIISDIILN